MKSRIKIFAASVAVSVATVGAAFWGGVGAWFAAWGCVAAFAVAYRAGGAA